MAEWQNTKSIGRIKYLCGYCGKEVGPDRGYYHGNSSLRIYICPMCVCPTYFSGGAQTPAPLLGNKVSDVPGEIDSLYNEARACTGVKAFTAAVLACRKILMNIAVDHGADEGKYFIEYVKFLSDKGYVPPNGKGWVDHIRSKGNEANHEIKKMTKEDALDLITFVEMLLRFIYEFPKRISGKTSEESQQPKP